MCGRFVVANVGPELIGVLRADAINDELPPPSYNVAPTASVAIALDSVKTDPPTRRVEPARWGLIPGWAKDLRIGARAINARSEELEDKPMFRRAFASRRAIVPATGYYEWQKHEDGKIPMFIHPSDDEPLFFAGLYEWWQNPAGDEGAEWVLSFTILTTEAAPAVSHIHDRMPVFFDTRFTDDWLNPAAKEPRALLDAIVSEAATIADGLDVYQVGTAVGNVRNNFPELIERVA